ncbi:hypothetical protein BT93_K0530 [Corymbia citriodora subsp. variegata]|nr:hypothetical protein BT93_K0530 [Corymbia citriodora subsp. variegata]
MVPCFLGAFSMEEKAKGTKQRNWKRRRINSIASEFCQEEGGLCERLHVAWAYG